MCRIILLLGLAACGCRAIRADPLLGDKPPMKLDGALGK